MTVNLEVKKEVKKIVGQLKTAQKQFQNLMKDKTWLEDVRKYAEGQGKGIKKLLSSDLTKVKAFLDREKKELDKFQKQIPNELEKIKRSCQKFIPESPHETLLVLDATIGQNGLQ